jgi:putative glutathione S-transferase
VASSVPLDDKILKCAMGLLVEGKWSDAWYDTKQSGGRFVRESPAFRDWVRADGSSEFPAAAGRYHLYVSYACPWASRTLVVRRLKRLEQAIGLSVVHPLMLGDGWSFQECDGCTGDPVNGSRYLRELYVRARPGYTGRVTVPVLWDTESDRIVSNESSDIVRMLNSELNAFGDPDVDLYPAQLRAEIDEVNTYVYDRVNDGVYRAGFATTQAAYEEAVVRLFEALDDLEQRLSRQRYLVGSHLTEADIRLFTTLVRFDPVYHTHFKCNLRRLVDYPHLWDYTRDLYQYPGVAQTVRLDHIKAHYFGSHPSINPTGIVPVGPELDWNAPHGRNELD